MALTATQNLNIRLRPVQKQAGYTATQLRNIRLRPLLKI